ncbi:MULTISPECIES: SDR family oxidoreductase [Microbacterium]|uniref:SDR family oxidoreductase n=1 Tax=Microbacterium TaxID=33882 RepID=UPI000AFA21A1|nr:SDR family oxidoreductase [Microbacterium profundi]
MLHTAGLSPAQAPTAAVLAVDLLGVALVLDEFGEVIQSGGAGVVISSSSAYLRSPIDPNVEAQLRSAATDELLDLPAASVDAFLHAGDAYSFAKRANQLRVQSASTVWGARGARINTISPGIISTKMGRQELDGESGGIMRAMVEASGSGRLGSPDDIAGAVEFLFSDAGSFVTGIDLLVDGGVVAAVASGAVELPAFNS